MKNTLWCVIALLVNLGSVPTCAKDTSLKDSLWNALIAVPKPDARGSSESDFEYGERINKAREQKLVEIINGSEGNPGMFTKELGAQTISLDLHRVLREGRRTDMSTLLRVRNIVLKLGKGDDKPTIVVGAHLDKVVEAGEGIIDDWSGSVMILHALKQLVERKSPLKHNFVIVCFAYEEDGLWGSQTFVNDLKDGEGAPAKLIGSLDNVDAMVNFECLGVSQLFGWKEGSTDELVNIATMVGSDLGIPFTNRLINLPVGADSVPFFKEGVRAITIDSLIAPTDFPLIHSPEDKLNTILKRRGEDGYRKTLDFVSEYLVRLDQQLSIDKDQDGFVNLRRDRRKEQSSRPISFEPFGEAFQRNAVGHRSHGFANTGDLNLQNTDSSTGAVRIRDGVVAIYDSTGWTILAVDINGQARRTPLGNISESKEGTSLFP